MEEDDALIGKVLNPKTHNVEKLIQFMPSQWKMEERITANDLGNGKFIFNFSSEEDLQEVLSKGLSITTFVCLFLCVGNQSYTTITLGSSHSGWR